MKHACPQSRPIATSNKGIETQNYKLRRNPLNRQKNSNQNENKKIARAATHLEHPYKLLFDGGQSEKKETATGRNQPMLEGKRE
jgi:hypothetical protein